MKHTCHCGKPTDNEHQYGKITCHTCDDCLRRIDNEVDFQSEGETYRESTIICPHCGHKYDFYDACGFEEGDYEETVCECCGKKFDLDVITIPYFSTKKSLCEMPEDYEPEKEDSNEHS
jgi:DNA-directed RNA polymerase subunit RPC12/RpoP